MEVQKGTILLTHIKCVYEGEWGFWVGSCVKGITCELAGVCIIAFGGAGAIETDLLTCTPTHRGTKIK